MEVIVRVYKVVLIPQIFTVSKMKHCFINEKLYILVMFYRRQSGNERTLGETL